MIEQIAFLLRHIAVQINNLNYFNIFCLMMIRYLLTVAYFTVLYFSICGVKKLLRGKMSLHAACYSWCALILCVPLSGMWWNDYVTYTIHSAQFSILMYIVKNILLHKSAWLAFGGFIITVLVTLVLLIAILYRLGKYLFLNYGIQKAIKKMEHYKDHDNLLRRAADAMNLHENNISIVLADGIGTPTAYGFINKVILLPRDFDEKYTYNERYLLILHEGMHIKNGDTWKLHLIGIAECFLWITPVMRQFSKAFRRDCEMWCDNQVMRIQPGEQDNYSGLILKASSQKNAVMGFGFSESYYVIESRLNALYRLDAQKQSAFVFSATILVLVMTVCFLLFYMKPSRLYINPGYNTEFFIFVANDDVTEETFEFMALDNEDYAGLYEVVGNDFCLDKLAMLEIAEIYSTKGFVRILFQTENYSISASRNIKVSINISSTEGVVFNFSELDEINEENRYFTQPLKKRGLLENVFLRVSGWLI